MGHAMRFGNSRGPEPQQQVGPSGSQTVLAGHGWCQARKMPCQRAYWRPAAELARRPHQLQRLLFWLSAPSSLCFGSKRKYLMNQYRSPGLFGFRRLV